MNPKVRLFSLKGSLILPLFSLIVVIGLSSCTTLVKKEYNLLSQPEKEQKHLISLLQKEKNSGSIHSFDYYDTTNSKLWIRYFEGEEISSDKVETYLLVKKFLNNEEIYDAEESAPDSTTDKSIEAFDSVYHRVQNHPTGEALKKSQIIEKVDSVLQNIEKIEEEDTLIESFDQ